MFRVKHSFTFHVKRTDMSRPTSCRRLFVRFERFLVPPSPAGDDGSEPDRGEHVDDGHDRRPHPDVGPIRRVDCDERQNHEERRRKVAPLGITGDAWDVASAAVFFASDESRFITGACLPVDGGVTQTMQMTAVALVGD